MGLFSFFKGKSNKPEYEGKPYEWFLSEDGKQSYLKYAENWKDMDAYMNEMVEVGLWTQQNKSYNLLDLIATTSSMPKTFKPTERQKKWPCHYLFNFLKAYAKKYDKDKTEGSSRKRGNLLAVTSVDITSGYCLYILSFMVPEDINQLKWPDFLTPEGNPLIYYIINRINYNYSHNGRNLKKYIVANMWYIHDMNEQGIDVSKESWLYDEDIYINKSLSSFGVAKTDEVIENAILKAAAYPDVYRKSLGI